MLTISQKCFLGSLDELALFVEPDKIVNDRMGVRRMGKCPFSPLEIGIKNQTFPEKPDVGILNSD